MTKPTITPANFAYQARNIVAALRSLKVAEAALSQYLRDHEVPELPPKLVRDIKAVVADHKPTVDAIDHLMKGLSDAAFTSVPAKPVRRKKAVPA